MALTREQIRADLRSRGHSTKGVQSSANARPAIPEHRVRRMERTLLLCCVIGLGTFGVAMATHEAVASDGRDHKSMNDFEARQQMFEGKAGKSQDVTSTRVLGDTLKDIAILKAKRDSAQTETERLGYQARLDQIIRAASE